MIWHVFFPGSPNAIRIGSCNGYGKAWFYSEILNRSLVQSQLVKELKKAW